MLVVFLLCKLFSYLVKVGVRIGLDKVFGWLVVTVIYAFLY